MSQRKPEHLPGQHLEEGVKAPGPCPAAHRGMQLGVGTDLACCAGVARGEVELCLISGTKQWNKSLRVIPEVCSLPRTACEPTN